MLELNWFWTYVSPDLFPNAASSRIRLHLVTRNISFDYFLQHEFLYVVIPQNPRYCTEGILEGVSLLILIVSLTTLQYTFMRVIGNVVPLLQPVIGWKLAMTTHHWNKKRKLLCRRWRQVSLTVPKSRFVETNYFESLESPRGSSCEMAKPLLEKVTSLNKDNHKFA